MTAARALPVLTMLGLLLAWEALVRVAQIPHYTKVFDYELEFGIFLSRGGRNIPRERAHEHIGGYVVFNDFSARDIQGREMGGRLGPAKGKCFDGWKQKKPWLQ